MVPSTRGRHISGFTLIFLPPKKKAQKIEGHFGPNLEGSTVAAVVIFNGTFPNNFIKRISNMPGAGGLTACFQVPEP